MSADDPTQVTSSPISTEEETKPQADDKSTSAQLPPRRRFPWDKPEPCVPLTIKHRAPFVQNPRCSVCQDAGWLIDESGKPLGTDRLIACECRREEREAKERAKRGRLSGIEALRHLRLENYKPDVPGVRRAYLRSVEFAARPTGWLVLAGGYGCGKTHLAAGIANAVLDSGLSVIFQVVPDLLDAMRAAYAPGSEISFDEQFNLIRDVQLLVLDDLGTEHTTPWALDKLYRLINYRYNSRLATVFTTNAPEGIEPRTASRMADRDLSGGVVVIQAEDYRQRK